MTKHSRMFRRGVWLLLAVSLIVTVGLLVLINPVAEAQEPEPEAAPPYAKGFIPPDMDLSYLTGQTMPSGVSAAQLPSKWDWREQGKVTSIKSQGSCGCCYAFAGVANVESRLMIGGLSALDLSENNAKECSYGDPSCGGGNNKMVANLFSLKGTVLESCDPFVASDVTCNTTCPYQQTLLGWGLIAGGNIPSVDVLKGYIHKYGPVDTGIYAGNGDAWETEFQSYDGAYTLYYAGTETPNHDVLIVGWDDSLRGGTGGWIVKNSWGTGWGGTCGYGIEGGYFTIAYGSAQIGEYSSFMSDWQSYDTNGGLLYYDGAGWGGHFGYGSTTAWGLAKFIPTSNTYATRVEFWTTDKATADVYLYDDFDGTTLSNKLAEKLGNSFDEAGYHSVQLDSPVAVTNGNDVVAVVKFTNDSSTMPIPVDGSTPVETGRTYASSDGSTSWSDVGMSGADVAIRLRTSTQPSAPTAINITKVDEPDPVAPGGLLTYTLTISNPGTSALTSLVITDAVPANTAFASASHAGAEADGVVSWSMSSLPAGSSVNRTLVVTVSTSASGQITNETYGVRSTEVPTPTWGAAVQTTVSGGPTPPPPVPTISKFDNPDPVAPGGVLNYTIIVAASSGAATSGLADGWAGSGQTIPTIPTIPTFQVTDTVPVSTTCCASIGQGGQYVPAANMVVWQFSPSGSGLADEWAMPGQVSSRQTLPGLPVTLTFAVTVDQSAPGGTLITNADYGAMFTSTMGVTVVVGSPVTTTVKQPGVYLPVIRK